MQTNQKPERAAVPVTIRISGEIDTWTAAPNLVWPIRARMSLTGAFGLPLCVDMTGVTFIDAAGVTELLRLRDFAAAQGGAWSLRPSECVRRILSLCDLIELFPIEGESR